MHEIVTALAGLLLSVGGWACMRTVRQLDRIEKRQEDHIEDDRQEFGKVYERINAVAVSVAALDGRVDHRLLAREKP